ncbi:hypothetical protein HAX54_023195 [Datura stramonium]|uniref:Uncharacterized protein n=1 Tax=Datura stramonium TaxID=4076 RepID=A0ABS8UW47_DATST|nr:hypothetical protein [Datura stramonium]
MEKNNDSPAGNNAIQRSRVYGGRGNIHRTGDGAIGMVTLTSITCSGGGCGGGGGGFGGGGGGGGAVLVLCPEHCDGKKKKKHCNVTRNGICYSSCRSGFRQQCNRGDRSGGVAANMLEIEIIAVVVDIKVSTIHLKDTKVMHMLSVYEGFGDIISLIQHVWIAIFSCFNLPDAAEWTMSGDAL